MPVRQPELDAVGAEEEQRNWAKAILDANSRIGRSGLEKLPGPWADYVAAAELALEQGAR